MRENYKLVPFLEPSFLRHCILQKIAIIAMLLGSVITGFSQCPTPPGDPATYATDSWIGYVYSGLDANNPPQNAFASSMTYRGYITKPMQFDYDLGTAAPTAATVCGSYPESFAIRYRMHTNVNPGYYTITLGGDDGVRLSFDGGATWAISNWNYHSYTEVTATFFLSGPKDIVLESYDQGTNYRVKFSYTYCGTYSIPPTSITGNTTLCSNTPTTLTANGATLATNSTYQWGTGTTIGNNPIAGQTGASITVTPTATTTYWVRIFDQTCGQYTSGVTQQVTVTPSSSAPTNITASQTICAGNSTTLTASGGTVVTGTTYEWGTGTVGTNVISGQTGASITVSPATTTTYWVRRVNPNSCGNTSELTTTVNVTMPTGDQTSYGSGAWIGYVYTSIDSANPPANAFGTTYRGTVGQTEQFDMNLGSTALSGANICGTHATNFAIRFKMNKTWTAGYYTFTVGGDDGYRFSMDGGATWTLSNWVDHSYTSSTTASIYMSGSKDFVIEYYERGGDSRVTFSYTACTDFSSAPTSISGTTAICNGTATTLTATGGYAGALATYQWGTGTTVGSNVISGQTGVSITVSPTANTTYWVRRQDGTPCNLNTAGVTQLLSVTQPSTAPTGISGNINICGGSTTLAATGGTLASGSVYEWGTGTVGSNVISGQTSSSITVSPSSTTTYWVRRTGPAPCNTATAAYSTTVTVYAASTAPTSISGTNSLCYTNSTVTLTANGGTAAANSTYQWGTGTTIGNNVVPGQTGQTMNVAPTATTTFWVRRYDSSCNAYTSGVTVVVYKGSTGPTWVSGPNGNVCPGVNSTLSANSVTLGTGSYLQWGTGSVGGQNIIANQNNATLVVAPTVTTTYWVRSVDQGTCPGTWAVFYTVNVSTPASQVTSVSGTNSICNGGSTQLTANGATLGSNAQYQWGTGTVGQNIFANYNPVNVNPTTTTTYWVRTYDSTCNAYTTAQTYTVTVTNSATAPTGISGTLTTCGGSTTLTATGGSGTTYEWGTGYSVGSNPISGQTGASITVSPSSTTTYWVRRTGPSPCGPTGGYTATVTVSTPSTAPTSISGTNSLCNTDGGVTLSAIGGTSGSSSTYQWGTGATVGTNPINGETNQTLYVNPSATTTYWVRRYDSACNTYTTGVTVTVYKGSTGPYSISGAANICAGSPSILTAQNGLLGTGSVYQWGTGNVGGANVIAGQTGSTLTVSPLATTTYWVRIVDQGTCPGTAAVFFTLNVYAVPNAVTSISGPSTLCPGLGGGNLTANGVTSLGANGQYQWGTGTVGQNIFADYNPVYINPSTTTTYWVRTYDGTCNTYTSAVTFTVTTSTPSTQPSQITATSTTVCPGANVTLTASGGTVGTGSYYNWGTGYTVGQNVIAGQTGNTLVVNPTEQTVYWVRRMDPAPCNTLTQGPTIVINMATQSTAPTSISGAPSGTVCYGTTYTLTANGGSSANGGVYQWGTGTVGQNIINGQTGATINVNPSTTTTYWVRRYDSGCTYYTAGATTSISITTPPGTPTDFGQNQWNVYGYSTGDLSLATAVYAGYYIQTPVSFDAQTGTNSWSGSSSPSSSAGWNGCPIPVDNFTFVYKRQGFPCGNYTINAVNWDDQIQVYVNGTLVWSCNAWSGGNSCGNVTGSFALGATSTVEIRVREQGGNANLKVNFTNTDVAATNPTSITGNSTSCPNAAVTLTANGGAAGTNGAYQWGTGAMGSNPIAGQTSASITVNPATTTTYWVRIVNAVCNTSTSGATFTVTVSAGSVAGSLTSPSTTICRNSRPQNITLSGNTGSVVKWQYANDSAFTSGVTDIANTSTTLTSAQIGSVPVTRYFRAVVQNGTCAIVYTSPVVITILPAITYNGTWSGTPTPLTPVIITANLNLTSNLNVCACQVTNSASITVQPNVSLIVQREIIVDESSLITVESTGSIVQVEDDAMDIGPVTVKRNTQPMKGFDYTYWSSPVQSYTLYDLSPLTRYDKYFSFNPLTNAWVEHTNGNAVMTPGRGYILRAPADWSLTNATQGVYHGSFTGIPNTGVVPAPFFKGNSVYNLIGNPYPSAIDIDLFITDPANANLVDGTIYLWTHNTAVSASIPGNAQYNYTADDYAKYNLTGGVKTASAAITGGVEPTGKVASGQGFFIKAASTLANGTYSATFRNGMRVANQNNQFFRSASDSQQTETPAVSLEKNRFWLNITNTGGAYDEMLVGYIETATNDLDRLFDGAIFNGGNYVSMYSILGANKLAIQGRALPFDAQDVIPVGYKTSVAGSLTIALEHFDGLFGDQNVYLLDKSDMSFHNLSDAPYTFTSVTGTFDTRFEIRFIGSSLGTGDHVADQNSVFIVKVNEHIEVSSGNYAMESVEIFDLTGKKVFEKADINATLFSTRDLNIAAQVLIVKVKLEGGEIITKKVVMY